MNIKYYPDKKNVFKSISMDDPLLVLVSHDSSKMLVAGMDDAFEHIVLLRKLDFKESEIDSFYRIVVNKSGADWTFVCPSDYKGIKNREKRIEMYYNDGIVAITKALEKIGYKVSIDIPKRFRRHFETLGDGSK
jgi:hypothetical protein